MQALRDRRGSMDNESLINEFKEWVKQSDNIVFFGGAGVSTIRFM